MKTLKKTAAFICSVLLMVFTFAGCRSFAEIIGDVIDSALNSISLSTVWNWCGDIIQNGVDNQASKVFADYPDCVYNVNTYYSTDKTKFSSAVNGTTFIPEIDMNDFKGAIYVSIEAQSAEYSLNYSTFYILAVESTENDKFDEVYYASYYDILGGNSFYLYRLNLGKNKRILIDEKVYDSVLNTAIDKTEESTGESVSESTANSASESSEKTESVANGYRKTVDFESLKTSLDTRNYSAVRMAKYGVYDAYNGKAYYENITSTGDNSHYKLKYISTVGGIHIEENEYYCSNSGLITKLYVQTDIAGSKIWIEAAATEISFSLGGNKIEIGNVDLSEELSREWTFDETERYYVSGKDTILSAGKVIILTTDSYDYVLYNIGLTEQVNLPEIL